MQKYLKAGIRLLRPETAEPAGSYDPISSILRSSGQVFSYVRDVIPRSVPGSSSDAAVPVAKGLLLQGKGAIAAKASVPHSLLPYGSIIAPDFYEQLGAAKKQDDAARGLLAPGSQANG